MWVLSLAREDPQKEEVATYSSILAWKIPWAEEPGRPKSLWLQRVRHDWVHTVIRAFSLMPEGMDWNPVAIHLFLSWLVRVCSTLVVAAEDC